MIQSKESVTVRHVAYRDIWFTIEISSKQLKYLQMILDHAQIDYDSKEEPETAEAVEYLNEEFYPFLKYVNEEFLKGKE